MRRLDIPGPGIQAPASLGALLDSTIKQRARKYRKHLQRCHRKLGSTVVHDLRISIRQLLAVLDAVRNIIGGSGALKKSRQALKRQLKLLGPLRDTHVQLDQIEELLPRWPQLGRYWTTLARRKAKLTRSCGKKLESCDAGKLKKRLRCVRDDLCEGGPRTMARSNANAAVLREVKGTFDEVRRRRRQIRPTQPATIHWVRVAFKQFRYQVEMLQPFLTGITDWHLEQMRNFQQMLGTIQDADLLAADLRSFARKQKPALQRGLRPVQRALAGHRRELIERFLAEAGRLDALWPPKPQPAAKALAATQTTAT